MTAAVTHVIDQLRPGGAQHVVLALARNAPEARVCALHGRGGSEELTPQFPHAEVLAKSRFAFPAILAGLVRRVLRGRASRIFVAHLEISTLALCVLRLFVPFRLVVTVHATHAQWAPWFLWVFRRVVFRADHVIVESRAALEQSRRLGLPEARLTLIPLGTMRPPASLSGVTVDIRRELGIEPGMPVFLNIARMVPGKGQIHFVRAMAGVPGAAAVLVGDGPEEARLREEVRALGLEGRVHFAGLRTDLGNFYPVATAFVMPCLDESMGVVIYDALTCKLPVVAYATGSIGEIVTDGVNGYLMQPDPQALAAALRRVLAKETMFRFLDAQAYSASTMVERHHALYEDLSRRWFGASPGPADA